jgi:hypothetical protein
MDFTNSDDSNNPLYCYQNYADAITNTVSASIGATVSQVQEIMLAFLSQTGVLFNKNSAG